ncbi:MAG: hypothetical protein WC155_07005 [Candidatus Cloacimonadales bacterium]
MTIIYIVKIFQSVDIIDTQMESAHDSIINHTGSGSNKQHHRFLQLMVLMLNQNYQHYFQVKLIMLTPIIMLVQAMHIVLMV